MFKVVMFLLGGAAIFLAALVSSLIGGKCGESRNRVEAGRVLGFFLGPLGWIIALLLPAPIPSRKEERRE